MPVDPTTALEKVPTTVYGNGEQASRAVAGQIATLIKSKASSGHKCVLGLATGSTPVGVYEELVRLHVSEGLSFANVVTINLDEYYPMPPDQLQSYRRFMKEYLYDRVDIDPTNTHVPDGTLKIEEVEDYCRQYEQEILDADGLDSLLLGIGRTGHIGFNEPGSARNSRTRLINLDQVTRMDAASDFFGEENVPRQAITMGVGTILAARQIILLAFGEHKAPIVARAVEGEISTHVAASFLQEHGNARIVLDRAAAAELTRYKTPWLLGPVTWDPPATRRAAIWLARKLEKPLLKLTDGDYAEAGLFDLLHQYGGAYQVNLEVFRTLQDSITGWPGGKPEDKSTGRRPWRHGPFPKRVLVFSPHPDDDVISMGGTLTRLVDQGHDVHVAYQTSGNIAVFDYDALRFADFAAQFSRIFGVGQEQTEKIEQHIQQFLRNKEPAQVDSTEVQRIKSLIRQTEAKAAGRACGVQEEQLHFLDLPFYQTGTVRKKPLSDEDVDITVALLEKIQPHQIYAAGDLSDPHGTHQVCFKAIIQAISRVESQQWFKGCQVWLYRGAWQEWGPEQIEMAVPISPEELVRKRMAIFKHQSQKDRALFPGPYDTREFWQRAEDRNRATAQIYDQLGLAEYEAIEAFVQWRP